jgi:hypothetical protein
VECAYNAHVAEIAETELEVIQWMHVSSF